MVIVQKDCQARNLKKEDAMAEENSSVFLFAFNLLNGNL